MKKYLLLPLLLLSALITHAQWTATNLPAGASPFSLAIKNDMLILGTLSSGIWISTDKGTTWTEKNTGITNKQIWSLAAIEDNLFAGTASGGVFRSSDNGNTWTAINNNIPSTTIIRQFVKFDNKIFASSSNKGIYVSSDNGATWTQSNTGITGLVALPMMVTDADLFAGVLQAVYRYNKATSDWTKVSNGIPNNTIAALTWYKDSQGKKNIFAGISSSVNQVVKTVDNGANWTLAESGIAKVPVATLASQGTSIFAGNDYGVWQSSDGGSTWKDVSTGFPNTSYATFLTPGSTELYVLQSAKVWKRKYSEFGITTSAKTDLTRQNGIVLGTAFPNPFRSETTLSYRINDPAHVNMKVHDLTGRVVATLVDGTFQPGDYQVKVRAVQLNNAPGIYFVRMNSGKEVQTRKIILE